MEEHPITQVLKKAKKKQSEVCEIMQIRQSTLSHRMLKEIKGSIEHSIEVAKALNVKKYRIVKDGYTINIKLK